MPPYYALARIYLSGNQQQKAIDQYMAILEKDPNQAGPHMLLGTIYDMQKQFDMSEKHYRAALDINPQFAPAANNLAYMLSSREGDIDEALKFAQVAKEKLPDDPSVMDTLGWIYYKKGLYGNAVQEFSDSLEKLPENATVNYHLGAALLKKGIRRVPNYSWKRRWRWTHISTAPRMRNGCCRRYSR
jgi:tetratricopeptide (TPR) repeat protein